MAIIIVSPSVIKPRRSCASRTAGPRPTSMAPLYIPEPKTCVVAQSNTVYTAAPKPMEPMWEFEAKRAEAAKEKKREAARKKKPCRVSIESKLKKMAMKKTNRAFVPRATVMGK